MTLSRTDEIRQVASEWEFDKRIHAPRAARLLKELLRRVLRIRAGAREACRRLRQERDSARRNLAALEWLTLRGYPVGQEPGGHRVSASPEPNGDPWFDSWEECARNAGMPG